MSKVTVAGDTNRVDDACKSRCLGVRDRKPCEESGRKWQDHEFKRRADAVDHHALQPFFDVVAMGPKDDVLVAEECDRDSDWLRDELRQVDDQSERTGGHQRVKHMHGAQEKSVGEERIEAADGEEADHFTRREDSPKSCEWSMRLHLLGRVSVNLRA